MKVWLRYSIFHRNVKIFTPESQTRKQECCYREGGGWIVTAASELITVPPIESKVYLLFRLLVGRIKVSRREKWLPLSHLIM